MKIIQLEKVLKESSVTMNKEKHIYSTANGEYYTGVTTISDAWDKSFFLAPWTAKEMANFILDVPYDAVM